MRNKTLIAMAVAVSLAGCATNNPREAEQAKHAGAVALGALAGVMLGNQFSDNPVVKGAMGVAGGYIAHKIYEDLNQDFKHDPDVAVQPVTVDGRNAINVSLRNVHFAVNSASLSYADMQKLDKVIETSAARMWMYWSLAIPTAAARMITTWSCL